MSDTEIKAGEYELDAQWDEIKSEPGKALNYVRHRKGDVVTLDAGTAQRLVGAGVAFKKGERQKASDAARAALVDQHLSTLPDDARDELLAKYSKSPAPGSNVIGKDNPPPTAGAGSGAEHWAAYAKLNDVDVAQGSTRDAIIEALKAQGISTERS